MRSAIGLSETYGQLIGMESCFALKSISSTLKPDTEKDTALIEFGCERRSRGPYYQNYGYLVNPSQLEFGMQIAQYSPKIAKLDLFDRTILAHLRRYDKSQTSTFFRQDFLPAYHGVRPSFQYTRSQRALETCCGEKVQKTSLKLTKDLAEQSTIFRDNLKIAPPKYCYLKLSSKQRQNSLYVSHASQELIERALGSDHYQSLKAGLVYMH